MAPVKVPSQAEIDERQTVGVNKETVTDITSTDFPYHFYGEDHSWDLDHFAANFSVQFHSNDPYDAQFSLVGLDASLANAFRRILLAEIPTLAIERVYITNNTSVIQDEVLAHRLGLVPLTGDRDGLHRWMRWFRGPAADGGSGHYDYNTVELALDVACTHNPDAAADETRVTKLYNNAHVYARDIVFRPRGGQESRFAGAGAIRPAYPDILIAKLRPGQEISLMMHAHKGVGADHAKFSPVATASYRLLPTITITRPILGADADKFAKCFPRGVIGVDKVTAEDARRDRGYEGHVGERKAVVKDAMKDTVSRECLRHAEFEGKVKLGRRRDHFIFSIESLGQWESDRLFYESVLVMKKKCERLEQQVVNMHRGR